MIAEVYTTVNIEVLWDGSKEAGLEFVQSLDQPLKLEVKRENYVFCQHVSHFDKPQQIHNVRMTLEISEFVWEGQ